MIDWILRPGLQPGQSLQGNQLLVAKVLSATVVLGSLILFLIALPARLAWMADLAAEANVVFTRNTGLNQAVIDRYTTVFPGIALTIEIGVMLLYYLIATLIFSRRSEEWLGLITAAGLAAFALHITPTLHTWMGDDPTRIFIGSLAKGIGLGLAFMFLYLFPGGYYSPAWMRVFFLGWIVWVALWLVNPESLFSFRDPYTISVEGSVLLMVWWATGVFSQLYRYAFVSGPVERQQTKHIIFGIAIVATGYVIYVPLREAMTRLPQPELAQVVFQIVAPYVFLIMVAAIPITIAFSILRYRLWDIDLIIRRTLIYSILSATLALIYLLIVVSLQALVSDWMAGLPNFVLAGSTLVVVILVNPLRRRIQDAIDRRFYRRKYDAEKALARFAALARDEADMQRLTLSILNVVQEVLQPEQVSIWLPADEDVKISRQAKLIRSDVSFTRMGRNENR